MKKLLLLLCTVLLAATIQAQYRTYKNQYDVKDYKYRDTDRYNPLGATFISFIVPGLGHVISGEPLRGLGFYAMTTGSLGLTMVGLSQMNENSNRDLGNILAISGATLLVGSYIWCITDVIKVSKIKNMHFRDQKMAVHLYPSIQLTPVENTRMANIPGVAMRVNF